MRILKPLHLVPQQVHLLPAIGGDLLDRRLLIHTYAVFEHRHQQLPCGIIREGLCFPCGVRVKDGARLGVVHGFVPDAQLVGDRLAALPVVVAVYFFEVRIGDLGGVLAHFDFRHDLAALVLNGDQLVDAAEYRRLGRRDQPLAHAEGVHLCTLHHQIADKIFVQRIGGGDGAVGQSGFVEHPPRLFGEVGDVARIQTDGAFGLAHRQQHLLEHLYGVRHAAFERVVGIDQQGRVVGIQLAVRLERVVFAVEHLDPRMRHGAACRNTEQLVAQRAGSAGTAADIRRPCAQNRAAGSLRSARTEFQHLPALRRTHDAVCLGGDQGLMIQAQQHKGLDQLRLNGRRLDGHHRLIREHRRALRHREYVAAEPKVTEIRQKALVKNALFAQIGDVLLLKMQLADVVDDLLQACRDRKAAVVGDLAEKHIEIDVLLIISVFKIAVRHGEFIEVTQHGKVFFFHGKSSFCLSAIIVASERIFVKSFISCAAFSQKIMSRTVPKIFSP